MEPLTDQNWLLTVGTFLPIARRARDDVHPAQPRRRRTSSSASSPPAPRSPSASCTLIAFDYGQSETLQFFVDAEWIPVINSNYTDRPRRHQPAAVLPVDGRHLPGDDLLVDEHARRRATRRRSSS